MSMDQLPKVAVREVSIGTEVIYAHATGVFRYDGPSNEGQLNEIAFAYGQSGPHALKCTPAHVAPKDVVIPKADDRVNVVKFPVGEYPTWQGPWLLRLHGEWVGFHKTKRDALATGVRMLAVFDWHAGQK